MKETNEQKNLFEAVSSLWLGVMFALILFVSANNMWCGFQMTGEGLLINSLASLVMTASFFVSIFLFFLVFVSEWRLWKLGFLEPTYTLFFLSAVLGVLFGFFDQYLVFALSFIMVFAGFYINVNYRFHYFAGEYDIDIVGVSVAIWLEEHKP